MPSLKGRLSLGLAASLVLLLGVQWWVASRAIEHLTTDQLLSRLAHDGETLLAGARFDAAGASTPPVPSLSTRRASTRSTSGRFPATTTLS